MQSTDTELGACSSSSNFICSPAENFAQEVRRLIRADPSFLPPNQTQMDRSTFLWKVIYTEEAHKGTEGGGGGSFFFFLHDSFDDNVHLPTSLCH
ncbi:hypothetical protein CEXT_785211 [Caerostris extrusa]|uniref:Uncharacterized protein n=1 Tax=Caerostris extrusa TaxID=172846 RepID=A0AAV4YEP8_CAEEX|nr:hypothetical protein CEXT_785211 [Caerostris extrusa]